LPKCRAESATGEPGAVGQGLALVKSLASASRDTGPMVDSFGPLPLSPNWKECVNEVQAEGELEALRRSGQRGAPFDEELWGKQTATALGLESSFRQRGRPRKSEEVTDEKLT